MKITTSRENGGGRPKGYAPWRPHAATRVIIGQVEEVLHEYRAHLPLTIRQVFYRLVGAHGYPKDEKAYARLCEYMTRARRARMIDFDDLRDDGVVVMDDHSFDGVEDFMDDMARQARAYRQNKQYGQSHHVELWCEAAGMMPQLARVAHRYSVPVYSPGGFASVTAVRQIVARALQRNVPTVVLHVGDYDPSGESISKRILEDASAFLEEDTQLPGIHYLEGEKVALTAKQVARYGLPTSPAKKDDSRTKSWTGGGTCQAEALPPSDLANLVQWAVEDWMDTDLVEEYREEEKVQRVRLLKALPRGSG
jgi:hypothetical protein